MNVWFHIFQKAYVLFVCWKAALIQAIKLACIQFPAEQGITNKKIEGTQIPWWARQMYQNLKFYHFQRPEVAERPYILREKEKLTSNLDDNGMIGPSGNHCVSFPFSWTRLLTQEY